MKRADSLREKNRKFFNIVASSYDKGIAKIWLKRLLKKAIKHIYVKKNSKILDVGCGTGNLLMLLSNQNKNLNLYGIDISEKMLEIAKNKLKKAKLKFEPAEEINFKDNFFDYVFSTEAFHHYSDYDKAMKNFYRILKKNGKLIIVDLSFGSILNWLFNKIEPGNNKMHSAEDFIKIFNIYRFRNIKQKRIGLFTIMSIGEK